MTKTLLAALALGLASCAVGPNYKQPDTADITPAKWRWQTAAPRDDTARGEWWKVFRDSELNRLEALALHHEFERHDDIRLVVSDQHLRHQPLLPAEGAV